MREKRTEAPLAVQETNETSQTFAWLRPEPTVDEIVDMFMPNLERRGLIRTKEVCPRCSKQFVETPKGFICPECRTVPRAYYLLVCLPGQRKKPKRLYSNRQGISLSSWPLALGALMQIRLDLNAGTFDPRLYRVRPDPGILFETLGNQWLNEIHGEIAEGRDAEGARVIESYFTNHLLPYFRGKNMHQVCEEIEPFLKMKRQEMKSDHSFKHARSALVQLCKYAHRVKAIPAMPAFPGKKRWQKEKRAVPTPPSLTAEEQIAVLAEIPPDDLLGLETATTLGLRPSEGRRVLEADFRDDREPPVLANVTAKNHKPRDVELPRELARKIRAYLSSRPLRVHGERTRLFLDANLKEFSERRWELIWNRAMDCAIAKGAVPAEKRCSLKYGTRHAIATQLLDAGLDPDEVSRRLGNSPEVLLKVYDHRTVFRLPKRKKPDDSGSGTLPAASGSEAG